MNGSIPPVLLLSYPETAMPVILFVCTANRFRSPIAAACAERKLRTTRRFGEWTVRSAGTWTETGFPAHSKAMLAATALGLNLNAHHTHMVSAALMETADLIIVMEHGHKEALECEFPDHRGRIVLLGELAGERYPDVPDPSKTDFEESEAIAQTIADYIEKGFAELVTRAEISYHTRHSQKINTLIDPHSQI